MPNILLLKRSAVAGRAPVPADLVLGELAVNVTDGKLYLKKSTTGHRHVLCGVPTNNPDPTSNTKSGS